MGTTFEETGNLLVEDAKEIAPPFKLNFVKNLLDRILITKKGPSFIPKEEGKPDAFFRGKEPQFLKFPAAGEADALLLKFEEAIAEGA